MAGFRLSPQQRHLCQLGAEPFRTQAVFRLEGEIDAERLAEAARELSDRHEILRTTYPPVPGLELPLQEPAEVGSAVDFEAHDWGGRPEQEAATQLETLRRDELTAPLELAGQGLWRIRLVTIGTGEHRLVWTQPALSGDRVSVAALASELAEILEGTDPGVEMGAEAASDPDDEPMQYADLAEWLNEILEEDADEGLAYWRRNRGDGSPPPLPLARPGDSGAYLADSVPVALDEGLTARLETTANTLGTSLEALLQAAWAVLLARFGDAESARLDIRYDGRSYEGLEEVPGLFARTLPIWVQVDPAETLREIATRLTARTAEAAEWQEYFSPDHSDNGASSFGFSWYSVPAPVERGGVRWTILSNRSSLEPHLVELSCLENQGRLDLELVHDTQRLPRHAAEAIAEAFSALLHDLVSRPEQAAGKLRLADGERAAELTRTPEDPAAPEQDSIVELIAAVVETGPERLAVICGETSIDYSELWSRAGAAARRLQEAGLSPGEVVAVCCERSVDLVVGLVAAMRAGAAYLPLDPTYPIDRLEFMVGDSGARFALCHPDTADVAGRLPIEPLDLAELEPGEPADPAPVSGDTLAYLIYTSGSTGTPKGVAVTHSNLLYSTVARQHVYPSSPERFLLLSSYAFDSSVVGLFWTLSTGGTLVLPEEGSEQDVGLLLELAAGQRVTHTLALPTLWGVLLEEAGEGQLGSLEVVAVAGEASTPALVRRHFESLSGARLFNEYGPTEATVWAIATELVPDALGSEEAGGGAVPIGHAIPYGRAYLLDEDLQPVPDGLSGEIVLGGPGIARGYLGRAELTAERFVPSPFVDGERLYRTGDRGRRRADGQIDFLGRLDHQVKIRGYRIEPGEIEARLEAHPGVRQAVVAARRNEADEPRLVAWIVSRRDEDGGGDGPAIAELRAALLDQLPEYMVPAAFVTLDEMPLTPTGKVDRKALPDPEQGRPDLASEYEPPSEGLESDLAARWSEILQTDRVGANDNFFELGGNSIQAAVFMNRIRGEIDEFVHVGRLFEHPTVRQLASYLESEHGAAIKTLGQATPAPAPITRRPEDEAIEKLDDMSDDEVDAMLEKLLAEEDGG